MTRLEVMSNNLLIFLARRKHSGNAWTVPGVKSKRKEDIALMQSAIVRLVRMGRAEISGGHVRITAAGLKAAKVYGA